MKQDEIDKATKQIEEALKRHYWQNITMSDPVTERKTRDEIRRDLISIQINSFRNGFLFGILFCGAVLFGLWLVK